jgi:RNA polymerase sigma-70 factor (ECF subfamily)
MDFEALVSTHLDDLYRYCLYLTGSKWDGEDLYQETLLKTYTYQSNIRNHECMKALLFKSAKHLWIDEYRKRRNRVTIPDTEFQRSYIEANYAEVQGLLEELAGRLPSRYFEILLLADIWSYSMQEIAHYTSSTIAAVKCALHRARTMLRNGKTSVASQLSIKPAEIERWTQAIIYDRPRCIPLLNREALTVS